MLLPSLFEKAEGADGTFGIYALSAGYKLAKRHAVFAGFRYAGGLKLKGYDVSGNPTKDYQPITGQSTWVTPIY